MTGHIRRRGERSWELKFDLGTDPGTGKRKTRYASFKGTKADAQKELVRLMAAAGAGQDVDPSRMTVDAFLDRWERDWATANVSPKTLERYLELLRLHVRPRIGKMMLQKLRPVTLSELYAALLIDGRGAAGGLAPRTVGHVHRVLHRALGHAVQWSLIGASPATNVSPPRVTDTEIEILRPAQIAAARRALAGKSIYPLFMVALGTGMRRGEMLALRWQDVDLDAGLARIERSLEQTKAGLRFKAPKTRHGRRSVTLPAAVISELRAHRAAQAALRLRLGQGKAPDDSLVFCHHDGTPKTPDGLTKEWTRAAAKAGLAVTLHALRHTHASQLIASGMDVLTVSRRLGHGSAAITLRVYGHLFANTDDQAARVMDAAFSTGVE
jgi:integrase